jgi:hypothetical protein
MSLILPSNARFKRADQIVRDGKISFALMKGFDFLDPAKVGDRTVTVIVKDKQVHNPPQIAFDVYGDPGLYWVVVLFNAPRSIFRWPELGQEIKMPNPNLVIPEL